MFYKGSNKTYDFRNFKTMRAFGNEIRNNVITLDTANIEQATLLSYFYDFSKKTRPRNPAQRQLKSDIVDSVTSLIQGREMVINAFKNGIFQVSKESREDEESQEGKGLKILTANQIL